MGIRSTVTTKGQTTIPIEVRERLKLKAGDRIEYVFRGDEVLIRPRNKRLADLAGFLDPPPNGPKTLQEIEEGIAAGASERALRGLE